MYTFELSPIIVLAIVISFSHSLSHRGSDSDHWLTNDQLCPNPIQNSNQVRNANDEISKQVILNYVALNLAWKEQHCFLMLDDESRVLIRAISSTVTPWNFTGAQQCEGMIEIKIQLNEAEIHVGPKPWCRLERWKENNQNLQYFNPQLSVYPKGKIGLSFSTEHWRGRLNFVGASPASDGRPQFLQFAYNVLTHTPTQGEKCSLIVQQYVINPKRYECRPWDGIVQHCGIYDCEEDQINILERMNYSVIPPMMEPDCGNGTDFLNETDPYLSILRQHYVDGLVETKRQQFDMYLSLLELMAFATACVTGFYVFWFSYFKQRKPYDVENDELPSYYEDLLIVESTRCTRCHQDTQF